MISWQIGIGAPFTGYSTASNTILPDPARLRANRRFPPFFRLPARRTITRVCICRSGLANMSARMLEIIHFSADRCRCAAHMLFHSVIPYPTETRQGDLQKNVFNLFFEYPRTIGSCELVFVVFSGPACVHVFVQSQMWLVDRHKCAAHMLFHSAKYYPTETR